MCICVECGKGFFQALDPHVRQTIHAGEEPFRHSLHATSFSHRTKLLGNERIPTGEQPHMFPKPEMLRPVGHLRCRLKTHRRTAFPSVPSAPEASLAAALM